MKSLSGSKLFGASWVLVAVLIAFLVLAPSARFVSASAPLPTLTITNGLNGPGKVAFDSSGNMWVPNYNSGAVLEYASPYTGTPTTVQTVSSAWEVGFDSSGNLWVLAYFGDIYGFHSPYTGAAFETISMSAYGMAFYSGNLWVSDGSNVYEFTASTLAGSGTITTSNAALTVPTSTALYALVFDSHGNLWGATDSGTGVDEIMAPITATSSETAVVTKGSGGSSLSGPWGVSFDSSGNLWLADETAGNVYEYASPYTGNPILTLSATNGSGGTFSGPYFVTAYGSNVWVSDFGGSAIYEFANSSVPSVPEFPILQLSLPMLFVAGILLYLMIRRYISDPRLGGSNGQKF